MSILLQKVKCINADCNEVVHPRSLKSIKTTNRYSKYRFCVRCRRMRDHIQFINCKYCQQRFPHNSTRIICPDCRRCRKAYVKRRITTGNSTPRFTYSMLSDFLLSKKIVTSDELFEKWGISRKRMHGYVDYMRKRTGLNIQKAWVLSDGKLEGAN